RGVFRRARLRRCDGRAQALLLELLEREEHVPEVALDELGFERGFARRGVDEAFALARDAQIDAVHVPSAYALASFGATRLLHPYPQRDLERFDAGVFRETAHAVLAITDEQHDFLGFVLRDCDRAR